MNWESPTSPSFWSNAVHISHVTTSDHRNRENLVPSKDGVECNDANLCTFNDVCTNGKCRGTAYTCDLADRRKKQQFLCAASIQCNGKPDGQGDGNCDYTASKQGTICRARKDACDLPEVCDGKNPTCPNDNLGPDPILQINAVRIKQPSNVTQTVERKAGTYYVDTGNRVSFEVTDIKATHGTNHGQYPTPCSTPTPPSSRMAI